MLSIHWSLIIPWWERADLLALLCVMFCFVCFVTFPYGVLGQVWYLIVSIPDLCHLLYIDLIICVVSQFCQTVDKSLVGHAYCNHLTIFSSVLVALTINKIYNVIDRAITVWHMVWLLFACFIITTPILSVKVRKAAKMGNRYNQVPHLTQDTTWESDKNPIKHHKQGQRGQPFPSR